MPETRDTRYEAVFEFIRQTYDQVVMDKLESLRATLIENGFSVTEPYDMCADEFRWAMLAWAPGREANDPEQGFDISISVGEQRAYDGDEDEKGDGIFGLNFGLDFVEYGGIIIGGLTPYNYTDECWVDGRDGKAVEDRWKLIEESDDQEAANYLLDYFKQKDEKE